MKLAPIHGQKRFMARAHMAMAGAYTGASRSRKSLDGWNSSGGDADGDLLPDLPYLRERSRDLCRNNPLAAGAINTKVTNIVGTGLRVQSQVKAKFLGLTPDQAKEFQENAEREYNLWASSTECDVERTQNFAQIQETALRSTFENGDVFALLPFIERAPFPYGTKIQLIEADRACNKDFEPDSDRLAGGVVKDEWGAPVKYQFMRAHPGDHKTSKALQWDERDAFGSTGRRNVLHIYKKLRPGQTRGVPDLAPVIEALKQIGRYTEAELMAAVVSGMFTVFIESEAGEGLAPFETEDTGGDGDYELGNGAIMELAPGQKASSQNPGRPNSAFDPFVLAIIRQIGMALELPFEILIKHFTASYSASRAALLEAWRMFKSRRRWLADMLCQPVYEAVITESVMRGRLYAPGFLEDYTIRQSYLNTTWAGDAPGQLDPLKEANAAKVRIDEDLSTRTRECAELTGEDWDSVVDKRAQEEDKRGHSQPEAGPTENIEEDDDSDEQDREDED